MHFRFENGVRWTNGRCLECGFLYICLNVRRAARQSLPSLESGRLSPPPSPFPSSPGRRTPHCQLDHAWKCCPSVNQRGLISGIRNHISMISEVDVLKIFLPFCKISKRLQIICATTSEIQLEPRILTCSTLRITNTEHEHRQKQESN